MCWQGGEGRGDIPNVDTDTDGGRRRMMMIDLELATRILMRGGYDRCNGVDEMLEYFATFDGGNKGYVTLEDLQRVRDKVGKAESEMTDVPVGLARGSEGDVVLGDAALGAMIRHFDDDRNVGERTKSTREKKGQNKSVSWGGET
jgi:hypothetical protein